MEPIWVQDVILPDYGKWSEKAMLDPLHPIHGPLPDTVQIWRCADRNFKVAIWATDTAMLVTIEWLQEESRSLEPLRSIEDIHATRGWIMQTYRWRVDKRSVSCFDAHVPFPETAHEEKWRRQLCEAVARESVLFAVQRKG